MDRWQELEAQTVSQQQQCRLMHILYTERIRNEKQLSAILQQINIDRFDDLHSLEAMCRTVQVNTVGLFIVKILVVLLSWFDGKLVTENDQL